MIHPKKVKTVKEEKFLYHGELYFRGLYLIAVHCPNTRLDKFLTYVWTKVCYPFSIYNTWKHRNNPYCLFSHGETCYNKENYELAAYYLSNGAKEWDDRVGFWLADSYYHLKEYGKTLIELDLFIEQIPVMHQRHEEHNITRLNNEIVKARKNWKKKATALRTKIIHDLQRGHV